VLRGGLAFVNLPRNTRRLSLTDCLTEPSQFLGASAQQQFDGAEDAVTALVTAAKEHHKSAINKILGPKGQKIISSGDKVADNRAREDFVAAYDKKHAIENEGEDKATLVIGDNDWPFPIPLVRKDEKWSFDTKAGLDEILRRRIGRNELSAIQVSLAYVQAQNEYASLDPDKLGTHVYAQRIVSSEGKKDGLYWPTAEGEEPSPLGDLAAKASAEGYKAGGKPKPYYGYYYRILKRQGPGAAGGAYDCVVARARSFDDAASFFPLPLGRGWLGPSGPSRGRGIGCVGRNEPRSLAGRTPMG
jgi:DUF2950 family protein